jgi:hypothetical protein
VVVVQAPLNAHQANKPKPGGDQTGGSPKHRRFDRLDHLFERIQVIKSSNENFAKALFRRLIRLTPFPISGQSRLIEDPQLMEDLAQLVADCTWPLERKWALQQLFEHRAYDWSRMFAIIGKMDLVFVQTLENQHLDDSYVVPANEQRQARLAGSLVRWGLDNCTDAAFEEAVRVAEMLAHGQAGISAVFHKVGDRGGYARVLYSNVT